MTPEISTPKTKVFPVIRNIPKSDKDFVSEIRNVSKAYKEAKLPPPKPSSVTEKESEVVIDIRNFLKTDK